MKRTGKRAAIAVLSVLPILMVLAVYHKLPEQVPLQWRLEGVSRYGEKWQLFPLAGMNLLFGILMPLFAKIDPKRKNYEKFQETYDWFILWLLGFLTVLLGLTLVETMHPGTMDIPKVVCGMVALLFIFIGNKMPKVKQNYFTGVKTPWALSNEAVWNKTQRLGGKTFFFGGILMLILTLAATETILRMVTIAVAVVICIVPTVMSYIWYQQEIRKDGE